MPGQSGAAWLFIDCCRIRHSGRKTFNGSARNCSGRACDDFKVAHMNVCRFICGKIGWPHTAFTALPCRWEKSLAAFRCCALGNRLRGIGRWPKGGSRGSGRTSFRAETNGKASILRPIEALSVGATLSGLNVGRSLLGFSSNSRSR
jgi:hypothetical protein